MATIRHYEPIQHLDPRIALRNAVHTPQKKVRDALRDLGPVVYYVRISSDLIKIGTTVRLRQRLHHLGLPLSAILAIEPGSYDVERLRLDQFAESLVRGNEWFRPTRGLIDHINAIRAGYGLSSLDERLIDVS